MINQLPKQVLKAEAIKKIQALSMQFLAGNELELNEFFGTMLVYARSASEEDLARLLKINMAEVLKHQKPARKLDA
jgi:hypothetical protein